jgi:signal transduction histidine kinase
LASRLKEKLWPKFWRARQSDLSLLDYRRLWKSHFIAALLVTLVPLIALAAINFYQFERQYTLQRDQIHNHIQRLLATSKLQVAYFLEERRGALAYVNLDNTYPELADRQRLRAVFRRLRRSFGGFVDLGVIDGQGIQRAYVGPYNLEGRDYKGQDWYQEVLLRGIYVSDVFLGHRNFPHFIIAVRHEAEGQAPYVLRATIDTGRLNHLLEVPGLEPTGDLFLVNPSGMIQTPSQFFGGVLTKLPLWSEDSRRQKGIHETRLDNEQAVMVGYAGVEETPFTLVLVLKPQSILHQWGLLRIHVIIMVGLSILAILGVIWWVSANLVSRIYEADQRRAAMLHEVEYTNKLASIGRLAAGVAHEINNPVAIINEKVGLMTDLLRHAPEFPQRERFLQQARAIKESVKRVSNITHRLLGFARHLPVRTEEIHLDVLIQEVLGFLGREAEYRNIDIAVNIPEEVPRVLSDKSQLQQVLLNILNNALAAVPDGGAITITVGQENADQVSIQVSDNGKGIPKEDLNNIFEPFFSTKGERGTGLGLSITYGIVQKLGGRIEVDSEVDQGTTFTVCLPKGRKPLGERGPSQAPGSRDQKAKTGDTA